MKIKNQFTESDGYPTEETLYIIKHWPQNDFLGMLDFIGDYFNRFGRIWRTQPARIELATGGWSGNEEIIVAVKANLIIWAIRWVSSNRGGHHTFELYEHENPIEIEEPKSIKS